jgi:hypothetical protein
MTTFDEIDGKDIKQFFKKFYDPQGRFFEIIHKEQPIGFIGVRPLEQNSCELEVFVFEDYRNTLTKGLVFDVLDFPKSLGFKRAIMTTKRPKLLRGLHFLVKGARMETELRDQKQIFIRNYS